LTSCSDAQNWALAPPHTHGTSDEAKSEIKAASVTRDVGNDEGKQHGQGRRRNSIEDLRPYDEIRIGRERENYAPQQKGAEARTSFASLPAVNNRSRALRYHRAAECLLKGGGELVFRPD
jgi:hypothetical protein